VPGFKGDNGGATYPGVTGDEIKIVLYNDSNVKGDMNTPYDPSQEPGTDATAPYQTINLVRTIKDQLRYFQARYETYGRTVHVLAQPSTNALSTTCPQRTQDADDVQDTYHPFAAVHLGDGGQCFMEELANRFKVPSFGLNSDVQRQRYEKHSPYIWGFFPDQEAETGWSASYICDVLYNHGKQTARFSTDITLQNLKRKFALVYPLNDGRGPEGEELAKLLIDDLKKDCNLPLIVHTYDASGNGAGAQEAPGFVSEFKQKNVTTVICYCIPVPTETTVSTMQNAAEGIQYRPEWYWDAMSRMFRAVWEKEYGDPKMANFGVSQHWRQPAFHLQYHYQAYHSVDPNSEPNAFLDFDIYHLFLNLFQAIQAAGPNLTPQTVQQGMFTFNYTSQQNPYVPTGGYGPYNSHAISDYTFVDTGMAWWWDPTGTPPGGNQGEGCLRVMNNGQRYYADQWPKGDADMYVTSKGPCSPDDRKLTDSGATF
jgi:hypothetical protein